MRKTRIYIYKKLMKLALKVRPKTGKMEGIDEIFFYASKPKIKNGNYYLEDENHKNNTNFPFTESQLAILGYLFKKYTSGKYY